MNSNVLCSSHIIRNSFTSSSGSLCSISHNVCWIIQYVCRCPYLQLGEIVCTYVCACAHAYAFMSICVPTNPTIYTHGTSEFQSTCTCMHLFIPCNTVESPNKGHLIWGSLSVLCLEVVLFGRSEMCWNYRKRIFCDLQLCAL